MKSRNRSWLCAACKSKIDENAYYCRNCDAIVRNDVVPGSRIPDKTWGTRLKNLWSKHPFQKLFYLLLAIAIAVSGSKEIQKYLQPAKDNQSSSIYQLQVDSPGSPLTCRLRICHLLIHITNKTSQPAHLVGVPYFVMEDGKEFGPADPKAVAYPIYFGQYYCRAKIDLKLAAREKVQFLGICAQDLPVGRKLAHIYIKDAAGDKVLFSVNLTAVVPPGASS